MVDEEMDIGLAAELEYEPELAESIVAAEVELDDSVVGKFEPGLEVELDVE